MKIECSGPNGETFECQFELREAQNCRPEWAELTEKENKEKIEAAQKALNVWANMVVEKIKADMQ